ncbi:MAG: lytic murein transglycosylase [Hyphomicrobiales bacterium]|nr:lytic murein transglycosylase [Hyphomicrobiales bacterium]
MRIFGCLLFLVALCAPARALSGDPAFDAFVASAWAPAKAAGVSRETFERATAGLAPDPAIRARPAQQGEFSLAIHDYLAQVVSPARVALGRSKAAALSPELTNIEKRFGAPADICVAIWGVESNFGGGAGHADVLRSFATLAARGERVDTFRDEFVAGLVMLEKGYARRENLVGSWAGAMGEPQFLPSAYLKYAVAYAGDGPADIWRSAPDSLASIARFMHESGWNPALPAVMEVTIPANFDWKPIDLDLARWARLGFRRADGRALPAAGAASLFLPEGAGGPAFLLTENWEVIRQYNTSDSYALSVALLADRIGGSNGLKKAWPKALPRMSVSQRAQAQRLLMAKGLYNGATDGKVGRGTRNAVHEFQLAAGMLPADGFLTPQVLQRLQE